MIRFLTAIGFALALCASPASASTVQSPAIYDCRLASSAATDNPTACSTAAGTYVGTIIGYNTSASARWLKVYDKATAPASTDVPREVYYLPPTAGFAFDVNQYYGAGMGFRIVGGSADNDNTAIGAGDVLGLNIDYR